MMSQQEVRLSLQKVGYQSYILMVYLKLIYFTKIENFLLL